MVEAAENLIIKVGTNVITDRDGELDLDRIGNISRDIAEITTNTRYRVILVSSGAVAAGRGILHQHGSKSQLLNTSVPDMEIKQQLAALGQSHLVNAWSHALMQESGGMIRAAQFMMSTTTFRNETSEKNAGRTIRNLPRWVIPILNGNDPVDPEEFGAEKNSSLGDNDSLAAQEAIHAEAGTLILLTNVDGLYDRNPEDPEARIITNITRAEINKILDSDKVSGASTNGTGGMKSKLEAARIAIDRRVGRVIIANGKHDGILRKIMINNDYDGTTIAA